MAAFDPTDYANDSRVTFTLEDKRDHYSCTLCTHRIKKSSVNMENLKKNHLRHKIKAKAFRIFKKGQNGYDLKCLRKRLGEKTKSTRK